MPEKQERGKKVIMVIDIVISIITTMILNQFTALLEKPDRESSNSPNRP